MSIYTSIHRYITVYIGMYAPVYISIHQYAQVYTLLYMPVYVQDFI